jgi:hypothetical protein
MGGKLLMAIPEKIFLSNPFEDDVLKYDFDTHQYYMTLNASQQLSGINLIELWRGEENAQFYLKLISDVVYTSILKHKDSKYATKMLYFLSHSRYAREAIIALIKDTIHYNHSGGGFMTAYQTGLNLHEMKILRLDVEQFMSPVATEIIKRYGLAQRYFEYDFDVVESTLGSEW